MGTTRVFLLLQTTILAWFGKMLLWPSSSCNNNTSLVPPTAEKLLSLRSSSNVPPQQKQQQQQQQQQSSSSVASSPTPKPPPPAAETDENNNDQDNNNNNENSFSGCLMVLDENMRLPEWIAYHYYVLPLRHLVITIDPASKTSPVPILNRWRDRINITIWTDSDFFANADELKRDPNDTVDQAIVKHQTRQRSFYSACTKYHQLHNRTWTTYTDADEFFTVSSDAFSPNKAKQLFQQPGSILRLVKQYSVNDISKRNYNKIPHAWYERFSKTPCVMIPRIMFTAVESTDEEIQRDVPPAIQLQAKQFETLRWRYRATRRYDGIDRHIDDWGKSIMDVSRVKPEHFKEGGTAHFALRSICDREQRMTNYSQVPIGIHHYLGSWDAFSCREDARMGSWRHSEQKWTKRSQLQEGGVDDQVRSWINGFVNMIGNTETAKYLLQGAGVLTNCKNW